MWKPYQKHKSLLIVTKDYVLNLALNCAISSHHFQSKKSPCTFYMRFALFLVLLMTVPKFEAPMLKLKKPHPSGVRAAFNRRYVLVSCAGPSC